MANRSTGGDRLIDRRTVLQAGAMLAAVGPALLRGVHAEAQPRPPTIIDSQVHAYEANTPKRPWDKVPNWPPHVTGDEMVAAMDKVGVDGAIFVSPFSMHRYDASYAVEVQKAHPGRFALVKPVDPDDPAVADVIADWKKTPGTVGIRIFMTKETNRAPGDPGLEDERLGITSEGWCQRADSPPLVPFWDTILPSYRRKWLSSVAATETLQTVQHPITRHTGLLWNGNRAINAHSEFYRT